MVLICKVCIGYLFIHISGTVITSSVPQKQNSSLIQVTWGIIAFYENQPDDSNPVVLRTAVPRANTRQHHQRLSAFYCRRV